MALTKEDRIAFSKQIVAAEAAKATIEDSKQKIEIEKNKAYDLDQANKRLVDGKTAFIDPYQNELGRYTGIFRLALTESDIVDSANFVLGNPLFPNDPQNPPPSTAPMVWTKSKPFARTRAVGKQNNEAYPASVSAEQSKISNILTLINKIETTYTLIQRVSGQRCRNTGVCSLPAYTDQTSCLLGGGLWTPGPDVIESYPELNTDYADLLSAVNDLRAYVLVTKTSILTTDPDATRQAQNNAAKSDVDVVVAAIDAWLALGAFNTAHGQSSCAGFNSYNPALLGATRLQSGDLTTFKTAITTRQSFVATRVTQIDTNLGTITQDMSTADATGTGFYFERWSYLLLRLNMFGGSLMAYQGYLKALAAQDSQKNQIDLAKNTYQTLVTASILSAPSNGTKILHVKSSTGMSIGNSVYLISDTQEELALTIAAIDGNRITVDQDIPAKYRPAETARLYKDISS